ncbi:interferon-induced protein 44-like [Micropterus salmoides]|uniref:interferon-induced protein 44-like n=1 Tax=Micropterus salmoides TaxID=27706 RepID=UPI0018EBF73B|nr:interferon-induced protein 44-like [Micropterus salmoides]
MADMSTQAAIPAATAEEKSNSHYLTFVSLRFVDLFLSTGGLWLLSSYFVFYIVFQFNPVSPLSEKDPGYNPDPSADDRVHLLVCVLSADSAEITDSILEKMKAVREAASDLGIPQMMIVTNIDRACAETEKDVKNVYKSKYLKKKMSDFSSAVGIPVNCIFPVKNYCKEIDLDPDVDALILSALRKMLDFGDDFIAKMKQ